jgi:hypothetical protein
MVHWFQQEPRKSVEKGIVPRLSHDRFLPNLFQFSHQPYSHPTLCSLDTEISLTHRKIKCGSGLHLVSGSVVKDLSPFRHYAFMAYSAGTKQLCLPTTDTGARGSVVG